MVASFILKRSGRVLCTSVTATATATATATVGLLQFPDFGLQSIDVPELKQRISEYSISTQGFGSVY